MSENFRVNAGQFVYCLRALSEGKITVLDRLADLLDKFDRESDIVFVPGTSTGVYLLEDDRRSRDDA